MSEVRYEAHPRVFRMRPLSTLLFTLLMCAGILLVGAGRYASAAAIGGLTAGLGGMSPDTLQFIGILMFVFGGARLYAWYAPTRFERLTVTDDMLIFSRGFMAKQTLEIPLAAVRDIKIEQNNWQRLLYIGDLSVYTGTDVPNLVVRGLPMPEDILEHVKPKAAA